MFICIGVENNAQLPAFRDIFRKIDNQKINLKNYESF